MYHYIDWRIRVSLYLVFNMEVSVSDLRQKSTLTIVSKYKLHFINKILSNYSDKIINYCVIYVFKPIFMVYKSSQLTSNKGK